MDIKTTVIGFVALLALVVGGVNLTHSTPTTQPVVQDSQDGTQYGAVVGPVVASQFFTWGGVAEYHYSSSLNQASTTVCEFTTPAATSTLRFFGAQLTTGTTTAIVFQFGKGPLTGTIATTLGNLYAYAGSNVPDTFVASTTIGSSGAGINKAEVLAPSTHIKLNYSGANGSLNKLVGTCKADLTVN